MLTTTTIIMATLIASAEAYPHVNQPTRREVNSTHKAGLAWGGGDAEAMEQFISTGKVQWYYTWSPKSYLLDAPVEYVPMLWGESQIEEWKTTINDTLETGQVNMILGMNEPQEKGQSNMTPKEGAAMWKEYINPLLNDHPDLELGSPAPSGAPSGKTWLLEFLDECDGCTVDFIACHWYDINATQFIEYMEDFHDTFRRPIAVTEWSCQNFNNDDQCTEDEVVEFLNTTQTWMDDTEWIKMYAYFGSLRDMVGVNEENRLMESDGELTTLGRQYIGAAEPGSGSDEGGDDNGAGQMLNSANRRWLFSVLVCIQLASMFAV